MPRKGKPIPEGTRMTTRQTDNARLSIKVGMIIKRLSDNFEGKLPEPLSPTQVKSAQVLLDRALSVLSATEVTNHAPDYGDPKAVIAEFNALVAERMKVAGLGQEQIDAVVNGRLAPVAEDNTKSELTPESNHHSEVERAKRLDS